MHKILGAMKNLAYIETGKLTQRIENQVLVLENILQIAADFLAFHPDPFTHRWHAHVLIAIGSERGFCGDFNDKLLRHLDEVTASPQSHYTALISVGYRLGAKLERHPLLAAAIEGAATAEEVERVLTLMVDEVAALRGAGSPLRLSCLHPGGATGESMIASLLPPFQDHKEHGVSYSTPPLLYLPPQEFFQQLVDQYLFAALNKILHESLMAENQQRLQHLDGALRHLDQRLERLRQRDRLLRQEEIIEEIEVILLGSTGDGSARQWRTED
jgi:F-type H+-transporting ATPase subunit gamma